MSPNTASTVHPRLVQLQGYLAQDPENLDLLGEVVNLALETGRPDVASEALAALSPALAAQPQAVHLSAMTLLARGHHAEAEGTLRQLAATATLPPGSRFNLAYALFRQARYREAIDELRPLLAVEGSPAGTLAWLIRSVREVDGLQPALAEWDGAPDAARSPEACGVASLLYFDADQLPHARELARRALAGGARPSEALVTEAGVAIVENRSDDAMALMREALSRNSTDGRLWSMLAAALMRAKDLAAARQAYEQAVTFMPGHIGTWHGLAWCQIMAGDLAAAARSFQRAMEIDRNFGETHGGVAVVAALQGQKAEAEVAIELALRLDPAGLSARFAQAVLSGEAADQQALLRLANRLLGSRPGPLGGTMADVVLPPGAR